jgi:hypothetical protein
MAEEDKNKKTPIRLWAKERQPALAVGTNSTLQTQRAINVVKADIGDRLPGRKIEGRDAETWDKQCPSEIGHHHYIDWVDGM